MALKKIDIKECHTLLLQIAVVFDRICREHSIPYYMLGGTMLGAVRHKGFIPWDDDMDFGIPRPYFDRFLSVAQQELPDLYALHFPQQRGFVKIKLKGSRLVEKVFDQDDEDSYGGIAVDIFPLDGAETKSLGGLVHSQWVFLLLKIQEGRFCSLSVRKGMKRFIAYWIKKLPIDDTRLARYIDRMMEKKAYEDSPQVANFYGHWRDREILDKEIFSQSKAYPFEQVQLTGVVQSHLYLTQLYGDYMQLPPKEQQLTHTDDIYVETVTDKE